jgi:glycosyltransferase involved in cell wall biosynthesis
MKIAFPHEPADGGPGSFQTRLESVLQERGWEVAHDCQIKSQPDVICIVGGTRQIAKIRQLRRRHVPVVYRLDGLAWIHRRKHLGPRIWLQSEIRNLLTKYTHAYLADEIIYQSQFVKKWWEQSGWRKKSGSKIIHNGVDLKQFSANCGFKGSSPEYLVCIEGTIDYSPFAVPLLNYLANRLDCTGLRLRLYGNFMNSATGKQLSSKVEYLGPLRREEVPGVLRNCLYLSLDVLPACPNTVVEALASGVPVIGYDTGAVRELVANGTGELADYGGDPWQLDTPDFHNLFSALERVLADYPGYCVRARQHAVDCLDVRHMTEAYIRVFESAIADARQ